MEDGWTVVRYGRRRQRDRQVFWDGYGGPQGGMDRARSFSFRRRDYFPNPNPPAPPPRAPRYFGPQVPFRSYAAVVRQGRFQPARRGSSSRTRDDDVIREAASPDFGRLIRKLHGIIKMVHHLQNVVPKPGRPEPRMIVKMVDILAGMIKPAYPRQDTTDRIVGNARNWGQMTLQILMEHYEDSLERFLQELSGMDTGEWRKAFEVASRWAKRNLRRITRSIIDHAEALISTQLEGGQVQVRERHNVYLPSESARIGQPRRQAATTTSVATMTDRVPDAEARWSSPNMAEWMPSPLERREVQRGTRRPKEVVLLEEDFFLEEVQEEPLPDFEPLFPPERTASQLELEAMFDEMQAEEERDEARARAAAEAEREARAVEEQGQSSQLSARDAQVQAQVQQAGSEDDEPLFDLSGDLFDEVESSRGPRFRVNRHQNTTRKMTDWNWVANRKWIFLGDSNLTKFPDFSNKNLQVESFPGADFRHAEALLKKTVPPQDLVVEKMVLSFGINSRANKPKETTIKNVQAAVRAAKKRFPYAEIWVPQINFSENLPAEDKSNLQVLNDYIYRNRVHIPLLDEDLFHTEEDDIHWTAETGKAVFQHWMSFLNCNTP
ncbi:kelch-like protein 8 [Sarotherodon galilaeus]